MLVCLCVILNSFISGLNPNEMEQHVHTDISKLEGRYSRIFNTILFHDILYMLRVPEN